MSLSRLYQQVILDHNKNPRNFHAIEGATHIAHGKNPLCGDDYYLYLKISPDEIIEAAGFQGAGCAISKSSASMLTTLIKGKPLADLDQMIHDFITMVSSKNYTPATKKRLGKLSIFEGVNAFPIRVKCASLIWRTLESALRNKDTAQISEISTE